MHEHRGGVRLNTYRQMGEALLGEKGGLGAPGKASQHASTRPTHPGTAAGPRRGRIIVSSVQYSLMVGLCITYSVTAGQSLKGVVSDDCDGSTCQQVRAVARDRSAASPPPPPAAQRPTRPDVCCRALRAGSSALVCCSCCSRSRPTFTRSGARAAS